MKTRYLSRGDEGRRASYERGFWKFKKKKFTESANRLLTSVSYNHTLKIKNISLSEKTKV